MNKNSFTLAIGLIFLASLSRLFPHPPNFTPVMAIALFSGFYLPRRWGGLFVPMVAMAISDFLLGFHSLMPAVYFSLMVTFFIGFSYRSNRTPSTVFLGGTGGSLFFYLITNFAVWAQSSYYPASWQGLMGCYVAALPFLKNSLAGDLFYTVGLFSLYELTKKVLEKKENTSFKKIT